MTTKFAIPVVSALASFFMFFGAFAVGLFSAFGMGCAVIGVSFVAFSFWHFSIIRKRLREFADSKSIGRHEHDSLEEEFTKLEGPE